MNAQTRGGALPSLHPYKVHEPVIGSYGSFGNHPLTKDETHSPSCMPPSIFIQFDQKSTTTSAIAPAIVKEGAVVIRSTSPKLPMERGWLTRALRTSPAIECLLELSQNFCRPVVELLQSSHSQQPNALQNFRRTFVELSQNSHFQQPSALQNFRITLVELTLLAAKCLLELSQNFRRTLISSSGMPFRILVELSQNSHVQQPSACQNSHRTWVELPFLAAECLLELSQNFRRTFVELPFLAAECLLESS